MTGAFVDGWVRGQRLTLLCPDHEWRAEFIEILIILIKKTFVFNLNSEMNNKKNNNNYNKMVNAYFIIVADE